MTKEQLWDVLGDIGDEFVAEAEESAKSAFVRQRWKKIAAVCAAAAVCVGTVWGVKAYAQWRAALNGDTDALLPSFWWQQNKDNCFTSPLVEYDGAYYEILSMTDGGALDRHGLPRTVTEHMVGERLAEVADDNGNRYTLYECVAFPPSQRAVFLAASAGTDGERYTYALFCNELRADPSRYQTAEEMFSVIGVHGAEDIAYVEIGKRRLDSAEETARFYRLLCGAEAMGEDGYQKEVFGGKSESRQQQLAMELAENYAEIRIGTKSGFCACEVGYEPTIGYVEWALNHYRLSEAL